MFSHGTKGSKRDKLIPSNLFDSQPTATPTRTIINTSKLATKTATISSAARNSIPRATRGSSSSSRSSCSSSSSSSLSGRSAILLARLNDKINPNSIKDNITKPLARMFQSASNNIAQNNRLSQKFSPTLNWRRLTKLADNCQYGSTGTSKGLASFVSNGRESPSSSSAYLNRHIDRFKRADDKPKTETNLTKNCTAVNDKIPLRRDLSGGARQLLAPRGSRLMVPFETDAPTRRSAPMLVYRQRSSEGLGGWLSQRRSMSLREAKGSGGQLAGFSSRSRSRQSSQRTASQRTVSISSTPPTAALKCRRSESLDGSHQLRWHGRRPRPPTTSKRPATHRLLPIMVGTLFILSVALASPLPAPANPDLELQPPVWMRDGLAVLEDGQTMDLSNLDQLMADLWPGERPPIEGMEPQVSAFSQLPGMQRRRLERDRVLEPPAWLRHQPARRNSEPSSRASDETAPKADTDDDEPSPEGRARQLVDQMYEKLLKSIIEDTIRGEQAAREQPDIRPETREPTPRQRTMLTDDDDQSAEDGGPVQQAVQVKRPDVSEGRASRIDGPVKLADELQILGKLLSGADDEQQESSDQEPAGRTLDRLVVEEAGGPSDDENDDWKARRLSKKLASSFWLLAQRLAPEGRLIRAGDSMRDLETPDSQLQLMPPSTEASRRDIMIDRIEAEPPSRGQLLQLANKLRERLEWALRLPQNSILGLYPLSSDRLLVRVDMEKLMPGDQIWLAHEFGLTDEGFMSLRWPADSEQNPLPMIAAILRVLREPSRQLQLDGETSPIDGTQLEGPPLGTDTMGQGARDQVAPYQVSPHMGGYRNGPVAQGPLVTYLGAVYPVIPHWISSFQLPVPTIIGRGPYHSALGAQEQDPPGSPSFLQQHSTHLIAGLLALLVALVAVKVLTSFPGNPLPLIRNPFRRHSRWSLWSGSSRSEDSLGGRLRGKTDLEPDQRQQSDELSASLLIQGHAQESANKSHNLDLLSQRLTKLLQNGGQAIKNKAKLTVLSEKHEGKKDFDEALEAREALGEQLTADRQPYRTSGSYIKSLNDVLAKARAQMTGSRGQTNQGDRGLEVSGRDDSSGAPTPEPGDQEAQQEITSGEEGAGVIMSQMDISAAHLILAYMEKHLEDKERLRREWLELNAGPSYGTDKGAKLAQLMLQKLAKVALADENRPKNRNQLVVPFDRNRVRVGVGQAWPVWLTAADGQRSEAAPCAAPAKGVKAPSGGHPPSDYLNASYIYDDNLRRPTHIIAQGPTELTTAQFWQMIWEQEISVIVMLTRLSECSGRMCHGYWPTDGGEPAPANGSQQQASADRVPANGAAGARSPELAAGQAAGGNGNESTASNGAAVRRVSVTSVFNGTAAKSNPGGQPIIANGVLSNNIICFDALAGGERSPDAGAAASGKQAAARFEVHLVSEHVSSSDYLVRNMYIINRSNGEIRTITQFHYLAWPDSGVPDNVRSFLQFRRKVHKSHRNLKSPTLVHCSDGGGRSGTYTLIDIILERIKNGAKEIDPRATLEHLRDQRAGLCANQRQFEFVLVALAEEIQIILNALPQ